MPTTPAGLAELEATLETLAAAATAWPVGPVLEMARMISGKSYVFGPNPAELATLRPDLNNPEE